MQTIPHLGNVENDGQGHKQVLQHIVWIKFIFFYWIAASPLPRPTPLVSPQQHFTAQLLYLLKHVSCFNKICWICCVKIHIQISKVWLKSTLPLRKYRIFVGLFYGIFCSLHVSNIFDFCSK